MRDSRERANTQVNNNSYEDIIKKYKNISPTSNMSTQLESIEEDEAPSNFSIDQMEKDTEKNQFLRKANELDLVNQNDSIFKCTLSDDKLKELKQGKNECCICHKSASLIHKLKQCKFCGNVVCKEHGKKKRKDPSNPTTFRRLCEICEDKYIRLSVETAYKQKRDQLAQQALELDTQSKGLLQDIRSLQNQVSEIQQQSVKQQGEYKQIQNELIFKSQKLDNETKGFQDENVKLKSIIQSIKKEMLSLNERLNEKKLDSQKKQHNLHQIEQEIQYNDIECQKVRLEIEKLSLTIQSKKQKDQQQKLQQKSQIQKTEVQNYQQYIQTDDSTTIQQFNPYLNSNNNLTINTNQSSENEPETSDQKKKKSKKESEDREEGSCCSIM
ncbi:unnamed protein product [Paramecium octaurelia]|uniref:FYVE-type domain-containing protein n=1 Tax=Paramecium octaurelia TaxID=43137 RepID=A0A8S1VW77_PAROT|nr:unnamed protein product [Paramecium octaurelia]